MLTVFTYGVQLGTDDCVL